MFGQWPVSLAEAALGQLMVSFNKTSAKEVYTESPVLCSCLLYSHTFVKMDLFQQACWGPDATDNSQMQSLRQLPSYESSPFCPFP